ncbi:MAG: sulfurtransferase [Deltaproteobacteria bacterium]|nr:sulfurtransferase [Deltaproteobacteria bacterium]
MSAPVLVDPEWIVSHPLARIIDLRWYLPGTGRRGAAEYMRGHIPGALFLDLDTKLSGPPVAGPGRHPLPSPAQFEAAMASASISQNTDVVVYDDAGGSIAARLWFLLRLYGHQGGAHILDGGLQAWNAAGLSIETSPAQRPANPGPPFRADTSRLATWIVDRAAVERARGDGRTIILDARVSERYRGDAEPVDARPGHIPGARSAPWIDNLNKLGRMRPAAQLATYYARFGITPTSGADHPVIAYCGSGVTACHALLALHLAGVPDDAVRLYEGSWSDWARDPALPAALGPDTTPAAPAAQSQG